MLHEEINPPSIVFTAVEVKLKSGAVASVPDDGNERTVEVGVRFRRFPPAFDVWVRATGFCRPGKVHDVVLPNRTGVAFGERHQGDWARLTSAEIDNLGFDDDPVAGLEEGFELAHLIGSFCDSKDDQITCAG